MITRKLSASATWLLLLRDLMQEGEYVKPRGKVTLELLHHSIAIDMLNPIVLIPERKLNYSFAAAEALWILEGDNKVASLAPYNARMAEFSDDGVVLAGAYGPRVATQIDYVVNTLTGDRSTRQAVMTMWNRNPAPSKDIPCTIGLQFMIRNNRLDCHAYMRSSDAWLGIPYDLFSFSMVAVKVACCYNHNVSITPGNNTVGLGNLYLTAGSSHIYDINFELVHSIMGFGYPSKIVDIEKGRRSTLNTLVMTGNMDMVIKSLEACRDKHDGIAYWRIRP